MFLCGVYCLTKWVSQLAAPACACCRSPQACAGCRPDLPRPTPADSRCSPDRASTRSGSSLTPPATALCGRGSSAASWGPGRASCRSGSHTGSWSHGYGRWDLASGGGSLGSTKIWHSSGCDTTGRSGTLPSHCPGRVAGNGGKGWCWSWLGVYYPSPPQQKNRRPAPRPSPLAHHG